MYEIVLNPLNIPISKPRSPFRALLSITKASLIQKLRKLAIRWTWQYKCLGRCFDFQNVARLKSADDPANVISWFYEAVSINGTIAYMPRGSSVAPIQHNSSYNGPLTRYANMRVAHAPGMSGTFSPPPTSKQTASWRSRPASRHVPWCRSGSLTRGGGENVPGIPGACATLKFAYMVRGPCCQHGADVGSSEPFLGLV